MGVNLFGIDVSYSQPSIDWAKVKKSGVDFVIIRAGYRGYGSGALKSDDCFESHYAGATKAGIPVGLYFFTQAKTSVEGKEEAELVLDLIKDKKIAFPIYCDSELANGGNGRADKLSKSTRTTAVKAFCDRIQEAGYTAGVYASTSWLENQLDVSKLCDFTIWCAQYYQKCTYGGEYEMWQYTSTGSISGISGNVDMNKCYRDFISENESGEAKDSDTENKQEGENVSDKKYLPAKTSGIQTVSKKTYGNYYITDNFQVCEFACSDGSDTVKFSWRTVNWLQGLRDFIGKPIHVTSGYRTASYNKAIGGATNSKHIQGKAVDHYIGSSIFPVTLMAKYYETKGVKCIICYTNKQFVHIDSRGFDGDVSGKYYSINDATSTSTFLSTIKVGSSGQNVKDLQIVLNLHGYGLVVDGLFGSATNKAVRDFQKKRSLTVDGIVGKNTWTALMKK